MNTDTRNDLFLMYAKRLSIVRSNISRVGEKCSPADRRGLEITEEMCVLAIAALCRTERIHVETSISARPAGRPL